MAQQQEADNQNTINRICPGHPESPEPYCAYYSYNLITYYDNDATKCENCTSENQIFHDFIRQYPGTNVISSVLFTGHSLYDKEQMIANRSYAWYYSGVSIQEIANNSNDYYQNSLSVFIHELSHTIGAKDHYHELVDGNCVNRERCSTCNEPNGRPKWCIMYTTSEFDLKYYNKDNVFCESCLNEIVNHLNLHHFN